MEKLNKMGIKTLCYHAGLKTHERLQFQDKWQNGDVPVIVATISFGMGVDKSTVRFVVHWGVPKDPASFYQESGRAGRDGKPSKCRIYYNRSDSKAVEFHLGQDLGKAGSNESKRKRCELATRGFRKVVEYCENPTECRHKLFSNYFGEPPPKCINRCDFCVDKKKVQEMVELFLCKSIQFNTKAVTFSDMDYKDLYGGGRQGIQEECNNYHSDSNESDSFEKEQEAKKAAKDFISKQFALRRNPHEVSQDTVEKLFSKHARVQAASSTSNKVKGLTLATREQYVSKILDMLYINYSECQEEPTLDKKDIEDCSVDIEYSVFSTNTNMTMYRNAIAKTISNVKKCTADKIVHEKLLTFQPKPAKHATLSDLFRNITKKQQLKRKADSDIEDEKVEEYSGFSTAAQALGEKKIKLTKNQSTIINFFAKTSNNEVNESEVNLEKSCEGNFNGEKSKVNSKNMSETTTNRNILKNLFGDEDSDESEHFQTLKHSSFQSYKMTKDTESRHNKDDRHKYKEKNECERKRRKSVEKDEDEKKRRKENERHEGFQNVEPCPSDKSNSDEKDYEFVKDKAFKEQSKLEIKNGKTNNENNNKKDTPSTANDDRIAKQELKDIKSKIADVKVSKQNGEGSKKQRLKKTEVGGLVVKLLTPAYAERRFESRDTFKSMARSISHALADKDENEIKEYVENFLKKNDEITSHTTL